MDGTAVNARIAALAGADPSLRLRAALEAGASPRGEELEVLVSRCGVEPDFFVRDMLTWALTRHEPEATVPLLLAELRSPRPQARSQALHTLSKVGEPAAWEALGEELLRDADDEVARSAWRAAVALVPADEEGAAQRTWLSQVLASQLGRGDGEMQLSLSRALIALGEASEAVVRGIAEGTAAGGPSSASAAGAANAEDGDGGDSVHVAGAADRARTHALATERMREDPDLGFVAAVEEAKRVAVMGPEANSL